MQYDFKKKKTLFFALGAAFQRAITDGRGTTNSGRTMAKLWQFVAIAAAASVGVIWPVLGAGESRNWISLGRIGDITVAVALDLAYVDESRDALFVAARLEGDFDRLLMDIPFYEHGGLQAHGVGARLVEVHFVYDCAEGSVAQVALHAAYDEAHRRIAVPRHFVLIVTDGIRSAIRAVETLGGRADVRLSCERLRRRGPPSAGA